jgi:hypothetical protein
MSFLSTSISMLRFSKANYSKKIQFGNTETPSDSKKPYTAPYPTDAQIRQVARDNFQNTHQGSGTKRKQPDSAAAPESDKKQRRQ